MDNKKLLNQLLKDVAAIMPTMLVIGLTEDKHGALFMTSPEKTSEKRAEDVAVSVAMMMEYNPDTRQIQLAALTTSCNMNPTIGDRCGRHLTSWKGTP